MSQLAGHWAGVYKRDKKPQEIREGRKELRIYLPKNADELGCRDDALRSQWQALDYHREGVDTRHDTRSSLDALLLLDRELREKAQADPEERGNIST